MVRMAVWLASPRDATRTLLAAYAARFGRPFPPGLLPGEPLYRVRSCAGLATTNCAFGGPERKTLFIAESRTGTVLKAELPVPGRLLYSHM